MKMNNASDFRKNKANQSQSQNRSQKTEYRRQPVRRSLGEDGKTEDGTEVE